MEKIEIQLSNRRIVPDVMTIWHEAGDEVDLVMDLRKPSFRPGSVGKMYAFHVLEHFFPDEVLPAMRHWRDLLSESGKLFVVNDDLDFLARSLVGADLTVEQFNRQFTHPTYFTKDSTINLVREAGFDLDRTVFWFADIPDEFRKEEWELVTALGV